MTNTRNQYRHRRTEDKEGMKQPMLIDVPKDSPSAKERISAFKAENGRVLDEAGFLLNGNTEREAIKLLCENMNIPCDL